MDLTDIYEVLEEWCPPPYIQDLHLKQLGCFHDPSRFKCVLAGRRGGKSYLNAAWLLDSVPGKFSLYFADTQKQAWAIIGPTFAEINHQYQLGLQLRRGNSEVRLPNGHTIRIAGIKDRASADLLRGQKFTKICGDECQNIHSELLEYTVQNVLQPTLIDWTGSMILNGTPGIEPDINDYWYKLCGDPYSGVKGLWSTHHWTCFENPKITPQIIQNDILVANGWTVEHPKFQREYLARWVVEQGTKIYRWDRGINEGKIPSEGTTVLGIDIGYSPDSCGFSVLRMGEIPKVHVVCAYKKPRLDPIMLGAEIRMLKEKWRPNFMVLDESALGKGYGAMFRDQFHIPVEPAPKQDKHAKIELVQALIEHDNLIIHEEARELLVEWRDLIWGPPKKNGFKEHHPKYPQDIADSLLYAIHKMNQRHKLIAPIEVRSEAEKMRAEAWAKIQKPNYRL